ncbi:hypothetical protein EMIT0232MI5_610027 [Pseudomonas sp. IT-232MI5]
MFRWRDRSKAPYSLIIFKFHFYILLENIKTKDRSLWQLLQVYAFDVGAAEGCDLLA